MNKGQNILLISIILHLLYPKAEKIMEAIELYKEEKAKELEYETTKAASNNEVI